MKKLLLGIVIATVAGAGVWLYVMQHNAAQTNLPLIDLSSAATSSEQAGAIGMPTPAGNKLMRYESPQYHFSILYPSQLGQVTDTPEPEGGHTVVFQDNSSQEGTSFQIYATPYKSTQITKERFLVDEPSGVIKDQQEVLVDGVRATLFTGYDQNIGDTKEVWFIKGGFLYEVVTYKRLDTWLAGIMQTWKFI